MASMAAPDASPPATRHSQVAAGRCQALVTASSIAPVIGRMANTTAYRASVLAVRLVDVKRRFVVLAYTSVSLGQMVRCPSCSFRSYASHASTRSRSSSSWTSRPPGRSSVVPPSGPSHAADTAWRRTAVRLPSRSRTTTKRPCPAAAGAAPVPALALLMGPPRPGRAPAQPAAGPQGDHATRRGAPFHPRPRERRRSHVDRHRLGTPMPTTNNFALIVKSVATWDAPATR